MKNVTIVLIFLIVAIATFSLIYFTTNPGNQSSTSIINPQNLSLDSYVYCNGNGSTGSASFVKCLLNQRIGNFVLLSTNYSNQTITGYQWILYPVAYSKPNLATLTIGSKVGYSCDGTLATLTGINTTYAVFTPNVTKSGNCPV